MTFVSEIPTSPQPERFRIELDGAQLQLQLRWNQFTAAWFLDIDASDGTPILHGLMLVTGGDLFSQFAHLGFGGALVVQTDHDADAVPTLENLGSAGHLYFVQEDAA